MVVVILLLTIIVISCSHFTEIRISMMNWATLGAAHETHVLVTATIHTVIHHVMVVVRVPRGGDRAVRRCVALEEVCLHATFSHKRLEVWVS